VIVARPVFTPVTTPVLAATVAIKVLLLLQVPAPAASVKVNELPGHTGTLPLMAAGCAITLTTVVAIQPEPSEYVSLAVPSDSPVTAPEALTVATVVALLVHDAPPAVVS
jgi:hypothetical protein